MAMILKRKSRYVLVMSSKPIELGSNLSMFFDELSKYIGLFGLAKLSPYFVKKIGEKEFIFRIARGYEKEFILALSFVKLNDFAFYSILTSGTIKSLIRKYSEKKKN